VRSGYAIDSLENIARDCWVRIEMPVSMGKTVFNSNCHIGRYTYLRSGVVHTATSIGRFCSFGPDVRIGDGNHPDKWLSTHPFQYDAATGFEKWPEYMDFRSSAVRLPQQVRKSAPIIGHDVWVGTRVIITRGVTVGHGAIIAAGATVTKDLAPYEIVGGTPAKRIRLRFPDRIIERLLTTKWWDYTLSSLKGLPFDDVERALDELESRIRTNGAETFRPSHVRLTRNGVDP